MFTTYILPSLERACLFDGGDDPAVADSDERPFQANETVVSEVEELIENAAPPSEKDEASESS
jgi:hypothetical protein